MKLHLYYGDGTPETAEAVTAAIRAALAAGGRAILLVPEQETVSAERRMLTLLPPSAQLRFEVLNFTRLANRVARSVGGLCYHYATPGVAALLMWKTLRELSPLLPQYGAAASDEHFAEKLLATVAQLKAYGVSAQDLLRIGSENVPDDPFYAKMKDIGTVYAAYETALCERFDDANDDLSRLAAALAEHGEALFGDTQFFLTSFTDFTVQEHAVIEALLRSAVSLSVALPQKTPQPTDIHLAAAALTEKKLHAMAKRANIPVTFSRACTQKPQNAREYLTAHLFDMTAQTAPLGFLSDGSVRLLTAASPFEEAEVAAAEIHRLVRAGARYRDITVAVREASDWYGILDAVLERENIPCFFSVKTDLSVRPLVKLILLALRIREKDWQEEDVTEYLKTGLSDIPRDDIDLFEEYLSVWHPRGKRAFLAPFDRNPDGYATFVSERGERIKAAAECTRKAFALPLAAFFEELDDADDAAGCCRALYRFLCAQNVPSRLREQAAARMKAGERREAEELARLWNVTVSAMEDITAALGTVRLSAQEFSAALRLVFARTDIGTIPTSADEVTVGSASLLRADHPRFVLVLGLNEGVFPRNIKDDGLLTAADKQRLGEYRIELHESAENAVSNELFYIYRAFCAPCEQLFLLFSAADTRGNALLPSIAVKRVQTLFKNIPATQADDPCDLIFTPAAAAEHWSVLSPEEKTALSALLEKHGSAAPPPEPQAVSVREERVQVLSHRAEETVAPTRLENYSRCPFAYFCEKVLRLRGEANDTLAATELGSFLHAVLENAVRDVTDFENENGVLPETAKINEILTSAVRDYKKRLKTASGPFSRQTDALLERDRLLAEIVLTDLVEEMRATGYRPAALEWTLGKDGKGVPVMTPSGETISLSGKVDRVDALTKDGQTFLHVIDYKTSAKEFKPDTITNGKTLQMPLYLAALCGSGADALKAHAGFPADAPFVPAGVTYLGANVGTVCTDTPQDREDALRGALEKLKKNRKGAWQKDAGLGKEEKNCISEAEMQQDLDLALQTAAQLRKNMRQGVANATPREERDCENCAYRALCRKDKTRQSEED